MSVLPPQTQSVTWLEMTYSTFGIVAILGTAGVAYLRLFVRDQIHSAVEALNQKIDGNFVRRTEHEDLCRRVERLERLEEGV